MITYSDAEFGRTSDASSAEAVNEDRRPLSTILCAVCALIGYVGGWILIWYLLFYIVQQWS